jgi:putative ATP-dependent endonuclease of the OLD family
MELQHPLKGFTISIANFKCFGVHGSDFFSFSPINVIIGRNNVGKSTVVDAVQLCIDGGKFYDKARHANRGQNVLLQVRTRLPEAKLRTSFPANTSGGEINGNHWRFAEGYVDQEVTIEIDVGWNRKLLSDLPLSEVSDRGKEAIRQTFANIADFDLSNRRLLRISAERAVRPEERITELKVEPSGQGVTNLVCGFINYDSLPRELVERVLLDDLNFVYQGDSAFSSIGCQQNVSGLWEIFLKEEGKGDVRLSESGSSLQSVFIILAYLRLLPQLTNPFLWENIVFALEEPENNLHPALLRRLLDFLAARRDEHEFSLIITTHSPVAIDWATRRSEAQVLHVARRGEVTRCNAAMEYLQRRGILDDLDVRGSDLLQSNGVIWVEGRRGRRIESI